MTDKEFVSYPKEEILNVLVTLNEIVVSLDRIGSYYNERESDEEYYAIESQFLTDWDVSRRLSHARQILQQAFSNELGNDDMDELERAFEQRNLKYWSHPSWRSTSE